MLAIEKVKEYNGVYHILHGTISPMKQIGPDKLRIKELLDRISNDNISEIIVAAVNEAIKKVNATTDEEMAKISGPLGGFGGMGGLF